MLFRELFISYLLRKLVHYMIYKLQRGDDPYSNQELSMIVSKLYSLNKPIYFSLILLFPFLAVFKVNDWFHPRSHFHTHY
jgi:hypothetical protein